VVLVLGKESGTSHTCLTQRAATVLSVKAVFVLEAGSVKSALSTPTPPPVTRTVGWLYHWPIAASCESALWQDGIL